MVSNKDNDEFSEIQHNIFQNMTPEQRILAAHRLYWAARELKAASIRSWHPELKEPEVQKQVKEFFMYARS